MATKLENNKLTVGNNTLTDTQLNLGTGTLTATQYSGNAASATLCNILNIPKTMDWAIRESDYTYRLPSIPAGTSKMMHFNIARWRDGQYWHDQTLCFPNVNGIFIFMCPRVFTLAEITDGSGPSIITTSSERLEDENIGETGLLMRIK